MIDENVNKELERLGYIGTNILWDPLWRNRADELYEKYGQTVDVIVRDVMQGGARDISEFINGYEGQFNFRRDKGWPMPNDDSTKHKEDVRKTMKDIALDNIFDYVFCPFMKTRAISLNDSGMISSNILHDVLCYILQGEHPDDFAMTPIQTDNRRRYLKSVGILTGKD